MPKPSMKGALGASISAETAAFQERLAKADAHAQRTNPLAHDDSVDAVEVAPITKVLREAFTIPETEHLRIETVRSALLSKAVAVSKSEVLRAGLLMLAEADIKTQQEVFDRLERVKTGRPKTK